MFYTMKFDIIIINISEESATNVANWMAVIQREQLFSLQIPNLKNEYIN